MGRFQHLDDWVVSSVPIRDRSDGFMAVIYRADDPSTIWRWMCSHLDHTTSEEALACGQSWLERDQDPTLS
jgi:hypothetical protein